SETGRFVSDVATQVSYLHRRMAHRRIDVAASMDDVTKTSVSRAHAMGPAETTISVRPNAERRCGTCTACCDGWVRATIRDHEMKRGVPCHFRGAGCCSIYAERPDYPCREFSCGWLRAGSPFPEFFRPDLFKVLVVPRTWGSNSLFYELV